MVIWTCKNCGKDVFSKAEIKRHIEKCYDKRNRKLQYGVYVKRYRNWTTPSKNVWLVFERSTRKKRKKKHI